MKIVWRVSRNCRGASAVEMALYGVVQSGLYFYSGSMIQKSVEDSAREIAVSQAETKEEVDAILLANVHTPFVGKFVSETSIQTKYSKDFAYISGRYEYHLPIPFMTNPKFSRPIYLEVMLVN